MPKQKPRTRTQKRKRKRKRKPRILKKPQSGGQLLPLVKLIAPIIAGEILKIGVSKGIKKLRGKGLKTAGQGRGLKLAGQRRR